MAKVAAGTWDGNYNDKEFQEVISLDAKAFSLALQTGLEARDRVSELTMVEFDTLRRVPKTLESYVTRVRDFAAKDGFFIL